MSKWENKLFSPRDSRLNCKNTAILKFDNFFFHHDLILVTLTVAEAEVIGFYRIVQMRSYCTETDDNTDSHLVLYTVKLVICGHSTINRQVSTVDKVSAYERLQLFTQFISILPQFQMFYHIHLYCHIFSLKCVVHTFLFDLFPHCV